ncbi:MAG: tRNA (adenosine(37)-N6)-dimethylallyltransferase MiaA, partial [Lachnospiraceae bacterium]|nr:tRNA (adenosine(37)-N6)-dimethylallyltransferase MiaA [Lachnospiraceae bacterium]
MMKQPLVILTGPTASGKTALSIALAKRIGGEIISADSMQVYRGMDIGSAKVTKEEMAGVRHHLIDVLEPDEPFHVVIFQELAKKALAEIYAAGHIPIVAGGTGFYIQALLYNIDFTENDGDMEYRKRLEVLVADKGLEVLYGLLQRADPKAAAAIHPHNIKRIIRALEFHEKTGEQISVHNETERGKESPYAFAYYVLNMERARLYERIEARVDKMIADGLVFEVS